MSDIPHTLTITRPDDWHLHVRDGTALQAVLGHTAAQFARAMIMPNLNPPVRTLADASAYRERILAALPPGSDFQPLMTLYLTDHTTPDEIVRAQASGIVHGVGEAFLAGATTNSAYGVSDFERCHEVFAAMQEVGLPLLLHGEVTDPAVDVYDRERVFIDRHLAPIVARYPRLKVVLEHITTREAVEFVSAAPANVAATLTAHHLLYNRNALFTGGLRPHYYCLPVLKRETHRLALLEAATSGNPKFFLGTDSAPHAVLLKEHASGCAGCYTAHAALELYAEAFEATGALDKLEGFASFYGADFYGLPRNTGSVTLRRQSWTVPERYPFGQADLKPLRAGEALGWRLQPAGA
ncbi:MAG: dihydroorotase [Serpentinimonas sp.]|nr:MAG: dihydroorotase [Comamonadaceae bacterium BICA1-1]MDO9612564.1 dihydroorotase [Serpentinimonas sp.]